MDRMQRACARLMLALVVSTSEAEGQDPWCWVQKYAVPTQR